MHTLVLPNPCVVKPSHVDRPVFIVGCGRSGTTLLYEILCGHEDLAWFSNYTARFQRPTLSALNRAYPVLTRRGLSARWLPRPTEGYELWDLVRPATRWPIQPPLTEAEVSPDQTARAHALLRGHVRHQGARRFLNKNTRNSRRIRYLHGMFPDASFIHIVRHPQATVASLLNVAWWPGLPVWCADDVTPRRHVEEGGNEADLAAQLWCHEVGIVREHASAVGEARMLEIRYEDLTEHLDRSLAVVLDFIGVAPTSRYLQHVATFTVRNANHKATSRLNAADLERVAQRVQPLSDHFGYELHAQDAT